MPAITPLINGTTYGWSNVSLIIFNVPLVGITKINYDRKQKKENLYGSGVDAIARGYGNIDNNGSIEIFLDEWRKIIAASPNKDPLRIGQFDITVQFGGSRVLAVTDVLRACEFTEDPMHTGQGDTKILVSIPLIVGSIEHR